MKLGLDIHDVIDSDPKFFAELSKRLVDEGNEVHIITGASKTQELEDRLAGWEITYTHFYSIVDWAEDSGIDVKWTKDGPTMDSFIWNTAKSLYCARVGIDVHVDDTLTYGTYFDDIKATFVHYVDGMIDMDEHILQAITESDECEHYPCDKDCPQYVIYRDKVRKSVINSDLGRAAYGTVYSDPNGYSREEIKDMYNKMVDDFVNAVFEEIG